MKQYLKHYDLTLRTIGPVFVGSGREISKKEYLFTDHFSKVSVVDINQLYHLTAKKARKRQFEAFLLSTNSRDQLSNFLRENGIQIREVLPMVRYQLDCSDTTLEKGSRTSVMECIKDPYGNPYIPGSSLKGMLRTILLSYRIIKRPGDYAGAKRQMEDNLDRRANRIMYLKRDIKTIEDQAFHTLHRKKEVGDAVNDELSGFIVSDSDPLTMKDIVLCQKVERHVDGTEKKLNLLRECIKPETKIHFTLTIDSSLCSITKEEIEAAVKSFDDVYSDSFLMAFSGMDRLTGQQVYLGGGAGFVSKTMIYPMFGRRDGMEVTKTIFDQTRVPREHQHYKDSRLGASPHIVKCTYYKGKEYQFGECALSIQ